MVNKVKDYSNVILASVLIFGFALLNLILPSKDISETERRSLQQFPELSKETVWVKDGQESFMNKFETYATDQFAFREMFRSIHAGFSYYGMGRKEVNGIYYQDGYILKAEPVIHKESVSWSIDRLQYIRHRYLNNNQIYFSVIPDKNYYFQNKGQVPYLDYGKFISDFLEETDEFASYIDLSPVLNKESYYYTDTHWRQECLVPVAKKIGDYMGNTVITDYEKRLLTKDFKGVYYGQGALPNQTDRMSYLWSDVFNEYFVSCYDTGTKEMMPLYNTEKIKGSDPYEFFLSGSKALITIENKKGIKGKELIVFRDSFGSSIGPLLVGDYEKVTFIDIRYISPSLLDRFVEFEGRDVLFLFSVQVLNNSVGQFLK